MMKPMGICLHLSWRWFVAFTSPQKCLFVLLAQGIFGASGGVPFASYEYTYFARCYATAPYWFCIPQQYSTWQKWGHAEDLCPYQHRRSDTIDATLESADFDNCCHCSEYWGVSAAAAAAVPPSTPPK